MLIDVSQVLRMINGVPMKDVDGGGQAIEATLKTALVNAVLSPSEKDSGVDKVKKYELAKRVYNAESTVEVTLEEVALLKHRVEEVYPVLICGQVCNILEGKA